MLASRRAQQILKRLHIQSVPVNPYDVADLLGISVREDAAGSRYEGYMMRVDGNCGIMLNKDISCESRKLFTLAHELGHSQLPWHDKDQYSCSKFDIGYSSSIQEQEANEFAAELLMPEDIIRELVECEEFGIGLVKNVSAKCNTSFISSALRCIAFTFEIAAIVVLEEKRVKYCVVSEEMKNRKLKLPIGEKVSSLSLAYDCFDDKGAVVAKNKECMQIDLKAWFEGLCYSDYDCFEGVLSSSQYNQVVSLVYLVEKE